MGSFERHANSQRILLTTAHLAKCTKFLRRQEIFNLNRSFVSDASQQTLCTLEVRRKSFSYAESATVILTACKIPSHRFLCGSFVQKPTRSWCLSRNVLNYNIPGNSQYQNQGARCCMFLQIAKPSGSLSTSQGCKFYP